MSLVPYQLKSDPKVIVNVPEEHDKIAREYVIAITEGKDFSEEALKVQSRLFGNIGIISAYNRLYSSIAQLAPRDIMKCSDEVYLRIAQKLNEPRLYTDEREEAWSIDQGIILAIRSIR